MSESKRRFVYKDLNHDILEEIFKRFKINPRNYSKYVEALTHSSYAHEHNLNYNYERFEFIGDSAISWIISNFLFNQLQLSEGDMSIKKAKLVSGTTFTAAAKKIRLDEVLLVGRGLINKITDKVLENAFEAFIGAVANDCGIKKASVIINELIIEPYLEGEISTDKAYKTLIQEALMRTENNDIKYIQLNDKNEEPRRVKLVFQGNTYGIGVGHTLKEAEENAAKDAYEKLMVENQNKKN